MNVYIQATASSPVVRNQFLGIFEIIIKESRVERSDGKGKKYLCFFFRPITPRSRSALVPITPLFRFSFVSSSCASPAFFPHVPRRLEIPAPPLKVQEKNQDSKNPLTTTDAKVLLKGYFDGG